MIQEQTDEADLVRVVSMEGESCDSSSTNNSTAAKTLASSLITALKNQANLKIDESENKLNKKVSDINSDPQSNSDPNLSSSLLSTSPEHSPPHVHNQVSDSEHSEISTTSMDSQVNVVELDGEKYIKLSTYTQSVKIHASCEKAYQQLSLVQAALAKTSQYIANRQSEVNTVIEEFCQEMGYKPNGFAIVQGTLDAGKVETENFANQNLQNLKRERNPSDPEQSEQMQSKRVKDADNKNCGNACDQINVENPVQNPVQAQNIQNHQIQQLQNQPQATQPVQQNGQIGQNGQNGQNGQISQNGHSAPAQVQNSPVQKPNNQTGFLQAQLAARQQAQLAQQQMAQQQAMIAQQQRQAQAHAQAQLQQHYNMPNVQRYNMDGNFTGNMGGVQNMGVQAQNSGFGQNNQNIQNLQQNQQNLLQNNLQTNLQSNLQNNIQNNLLSGNLNSKATSHWNDAMYNLLSRAQGFQASNPPSTAIQAAAVHAVQARVQQAKLVNALKQQQQAVISTKVPAKVEKPVKKETNEVKSEKLAEKSDSGHDSEKERKKSDCSKSEDKKEEAVSAASKSENLTSKTEKTEGEAKQPNQQVKPQWIIKRMEKLKSQKKTEGEDIKDETEYLPLDADIQPELIEDEDIDAEIDIDDDGNSANLENAAAMLTAANNSKKTTVLDPKSYTISCKQCRWTLRKWEAWARKRNNGELKYLETQPTDTAPVDFLTLTTTKELVYWMSKFIREIRKDNSEAYQIDSITAFAFSLQKVLKETGRQVDILRNEKFVPFLEAMNEAMDCSVKTVVLNPTPRNEEESLWRSGELGHHTPEALTQTLCLTIVKHLKIRSSQAHR
jgi:hypothetical protein